MKILILGALDKEINVLNKLISAKKNGSYCVAKMKKNRVFTAVTGVGIMNAASSTATLVNQLKPDCVINIGSAGGHTTKINAGDIVVCDKAIYHGGYIMTEEPTKNWETIEETNLELNGDEKLSKLIDKFDTNVKIYHGATLSGDFFTRDKEYILALQKKHHHLCEDMETIAIYHVCQSKKVPVIAYRIIANNELQGTLYEDNVDEVNQKLQTVIAELLNSLD